MENENPSTHIWSMLVVNQIELHPLFNQDELQS